MQTVNEVAEVELHIHGGSDVAFEVEWWADEDGTDPVVLASGLVTIKFEDEDAVTIVADVDSNVATFLADDATVDAWPHKENGKWTCHVISVEGEEKRIARGPVRFFL